MAEAPDLPIDEASQITSQEASRPPILLKACPSLRGGTVLREDPTTHGLRFVDCPEKDIASVSFITDDLRYGVRDITRNSTARDCGYHSFENLRKSASIAQSKSEPLRLSPDKICDFTKDDLKQCSLFSHPRSSACFVAGQTELLGRFDILCVPASADFDNLWQPVNALHQKEFWVFHAAALNIGESMSASDFPEYCTQDASTAPPMTYLDEERFVEDMSAIMCNALTAMIAGKNCSDIVWFPFGMGAFMRKLGQLDPTYDYHPKMSALKRRLAASFAMAVSQIVIPAGRKVHLCLIAVDDESTDNFNAFTQALSSYAGIVGDQVVIYANTDALSLAQRLANEGRTVGLLNGANRKMIGNHWFLRGARVAIDENLHRRSQRLANVALVLNQGLAPLALPSPDELRLRVELWGGSSVLLSDASTGPP